MNDSHLDKSSPDLLNNSMAAPTTRSDMPDLSTAPLFTIAHAIEADWENVNYAARPYLDAMKELNHISDAYYADGGEMVVAYFLSNASSWRGDVARAVKAELKARLGR